MELRPPADVNRPPVVRHLTGLPARRERANSALRLELLQARADLANARELILIQRQALGLDPADPPPPQLVAAWHAGSPSYVPVTVEIDGAAVTLIVRGPARAAHPVREAHDWQQIKRIWREVHREVGGVA